MEPIFGEKVSGNVLNISELRIIRNVIPSVIPVKLAIASASRNPGSLDFRCHGNDGACETDFSWNFGERTVAG